MVKITRNEITTQVNVLYSQSNFDLNATARNCNILVSERGISACHTGSGLHLAPSSSTTHYRLVQL